MIQLVGFIVLVTLSVDVFGCDSNGLNQCVATSSMGGDPENQDPCVSYRAIMGCIARFNTTCQTEVQAYTPSLEPLVTLCGGGGGTGGGCDMQALSLCMSSMSSMQGVMTGETAPTGADLKQVCDGYKTFQTCVANLPPACVKVIESNDMMGGQMSVMIDQYCGADGCDMMGVTGCMKTIADLDISFDGESALSSIVKASSQCGPLQNVLTCLEPKLEGCKDNDLMKNTSAILDQMKMLVKFVCEEKQQAIMDVAECAVKPVAMQKLSACESQHPMSSDPTKESKEQLCTEVTTMSSCLKQATEDLCTPKETDTMVSLLKDAMKMFLKGQDPCEVSGAGMMMGSLWTSLALVVAAMLL